MTLRARGTDARVFLLNAASSRKMARDLLLSGRYPHHAQLATARKLDHPYPSKGILGRRRCRRPLQPGVVGVNARYLTLPVCVSSNSVPDSSAGVRLYLPVRGSLPGLRA